jgi:hypothetical protein
MERDPGFTMVHSLEYQMMDKVEKSVIPSLKVIVQNVHHQLGCTAGFIPLGNM